MKLFISWSGELSHLVALTFREWIGVVLQSVEPYVSSEDIDKGVRWNTDIASELHASELGVICVTQDNLAAPWLNFEAGALSKAMDSARVAPLLFEVPRKDVQGPLLSFQSTLAEKGDIRKLLTSIDQSTERDSLGETRLDAVFEKWWPDLRDRLTSLKNRTVPNEALIRDPDQVLEEILDLVRDQHRLLRADSHQITPRGRALFGLALSTVEQVAERSAVGDANPVDVYAASRDAAELLRRLSQELGLES